MNIAQTEKNTVSKKRPWMLPGERVYRRIILIVAALTLIGIIANSWYQANQKGEEVLVEHTENLAQVIMAQAQNEAKIWFIEDNYNGLENLAQHLQSQEAILEVSIQDELGRNLVRVGHDLPLHTYLANLPDSIWAVPMVSAVLDRSETGSHLLGFVRITFDYDRITAQSRPYHRASLQQQAFLLLLAFVAGVLVTFSFLRRRRPISVHSEPDVTVYEAPDNDAHTNK
ncbi:hypothetical protein CWE13_04760 [Aliidiomarina shirensis]|uniref:Uncharacterized protein n=1 Tax=Aliidiomarina shirensis TaxID=1048642 RepID=A0A432WU52_9GAMM|nr:AhpA/YtjB family protein [Aliidiomarina shirensis]RUO37278.1 hypothetical protein CWE13_04760 [Aliidiomarina shirensis]